MLGRKCINNKVQQNETVAVYSLGVTSQQFDVAYIFELFMQVIQVLLVLILLDSCGSKAKSHSLLMAKIY